MKYYLRISLCLTILLAQFTYSQQYRFTEQDSLRGSITPERAWWDLVYYDLQVAVVPQERYISGSNIIHYTVLKEGQSLQVDLQPPMKITKITQEGVSLEFSSKVNAHFVHLKKPQRTGETNTLTIYFEGRPKIALNPPWDGGFSWAKDPEGNHFIATSCQGLGASVWWPNKDHMYDEVDSMSIKLTAPKDLVGVANGRLKHVEDLRDNKTYHWFVTNPINNYGVNVNLARYVNFSDSYQGEKGKLDLDYYVLPHNLEKAREHFKQVPLMLAAFEHWFGPYPFYEDSFKIVETPYLGMEHQSSITYGNGYQNGYLGYDRSGTGWGLKFDYIIIHEAGHEWFANNITYRDMADLWIHEAFTNYSEALYLDYHYGKEAAAEYIIGLRNQIYNDKPIIAPYGVNQAGSVDVYNKGANMLHTLRYLINNDSLWRQILRGLNSTFYHQTVSTEQIENYISQASGMDLDPFFDQYLRTPLIPVLEYRLEGDALHFRYADVVRGFEMPIRVEINGKPTKLKPGKEWQSKHFSDSIKTFEVDGNFYVDTRKVGRS